MTDARARVVVYDAHWATAGGGETYAAGVAEVLSRHHDVTLLAHAPVDTGWLGERLAMDLSRVGVRVVEPTLPLAEASAGYDLLVNLSYRDHGRNGARAGVYVVHFPDRPGADAAPWQLALVRAGAPLRSRVVVPEVVRGFHRPDVIRQQSVAWTDGHGVLEVPARGTPLHLALGRFVPGGRRRHLQVLVDGTVRASVTLEPARSRLDALRPVAVEVQIPPAAHPAVVELVSESDVAHDLLGNGDHRRLGVPVVGATVGGSTAAWLARQASLLVADPPGTGWLDSYDVVVANSPFTRRWIDRWWQRRSVVLEPPVRLREPAPKRPVILSVGRFFAAGRGHSKKQLELVEAFGRLRRTGLAEGWTLHLVGGCSPDDRPYLDEVRRAAEGLPVELHVDASGTELDALYRVASVYWHATGLGEDVEADPERAEHFGITTVEAMSAGAVPVVMGAGGQPDIVRDGIDGWVFRDLDGLVAATARLLGDPELREGMGASARARAERYGMDAFAHGLLALVDPLLSGGGRSGPDRSGP